MLGGEPDVALVLQADHSGDALGCGRGRLLLREAADGAANRDDAAGDADGDVGRIDASVEVELLADVRFDPFVRLANGFCA